MAVERVLSNLNLISFKTEGGLQNHIDELQDGDLVFTPDNSLKGNLFDFKWTDHKLNDISWLNADTFSWQSGDVYVAAYEHLVDDFGKLYAWTLGTGSYYYTLTETPAVGDNVYSSNKNDDPSIIDNVDGGTITFVDPRSGDQRVATRDATGDSTPFVLGIGLKTEMVGDITIEYYRAEDGHKICLPDQEANVLALYESTGVAWYYVLDTANKQFKLPRTKFGFTGLRDSVGNYVEAGLPDHTHTRGTMNITGKIGAGGSATSKNVQEGAFYYIDQLKSKTRSAAEDNEYYNATVGFDASRTWSGSTSGASNSIYGNSDTVQPKATQMYLYFYVGNFERDALEQTAGITSEQLNNKLDKSAEISLVPTGSVTAFAGTTAPTGWLKCDGSAISRTTYAKLFTAIGTTYGAGDGSATFNLPNLTGACYQKSGIGVSGQYVLDVVTLPNTVYTAPSDGLLVIAIQDAWKENYGLTVYNPDGGIYAGGWRIDDTDGNTETTTFYVPMVKGARVDVTSSTGSITMRAGRFYPFKTYPTMTQCIKY